MASWTDEEIQAVWDKAEKVSRRAEEAGFRKDQCGAWIHRDAYGKRDGTYSAYAWEIDHIKPKSKGGKDILSNLRPLHWANNASRQADRLTTVVTSDGDHNIYKDTGERL